MMWKVARTWLLLMYWRSKAPNISPVLDLGPLVQCSCHPLSGSLVFVAVHQKRQIPESKNSASLTSWCPICRSAFWPESTRGAQGCVDMPVQYSVALGCLGFALQTPSPTSASLYAPNDNELPNKNKRNQICKETTTGECPIGNLFCTLNHSPSDPLPSLMGREGLSI